jgi:hypothetical protein
VLGIIKKHRQEKRVMHVTREMLQGLMAQARAIGKATGGGDVRNTAFLERFHATMRERLATRTRRCRHASPRLEMVQAGMWLIGTTSNWCLPHRQLSRREAKAQGMRGEILLSPAMASGLTDHLWSLSERWWDRRTPAAMPPPKRGRGRPRKQAPSDPSGGSASKQHVSMDRLEATVASTNEGALPRLFFEK